MRRTHCESATTHPRLNRLEGAPHSPLHARCVFGEPLRADEKVEEPTDEQVTELHDRYCKALAALFEKHKAEAGYSNDEVLVIH